MQNRDLKFFNIAKSISKLSNFTERVGAILVIRNEIIATGYNRLKSHPLQANFAKLAGRPKAIYVHAEMECFIKANNLRVTPDLSNAKLYVYREIKQGTLALAKPCEICSLAISHFGVKKVFYTTDGGYCEEFYPSEAKNHPLQGSG